MNTVFNLPFDTVVTVLSQLWNAGGIPILLGTVAAGLTQYVKFSPTILPFINANNTWLTRGFVVVVCVCLQLIFDIISRQPINAGIIHDLVINYFAASASYMHLFRPMELPAVSTVK